MLGKGFVGMETAYQFPLHSSCRGGLFIGMVGGDFGK